MLEPRLMADRRPGIRFGRMRLGWIFAAISVYLIKPLGLAVVRLHIVVRDRPGRRDAGVMSYFSEVLAAQPEQRCPVELRVSAHVVIGVRMQFFAIDIAPFFFRVVFGFDVDGLRIPVVLLTPDVIAALEDQNSFA